MTLHARAGSLLILAASAAAPLGAQEPAPEPTRCTAAPRDAAEAGMVRYECAGAAHTRAVRFSVSLPEGWEIEQSENLAIHLRAQQGGRGGPSVFVQVADQLREPLTAADTAGFWTFATDLMLNRTPTPREVAEFRRDAGDEEGARFMVTREQTSDTGLVVLAGLLASTRPEVEVIGQTREIRTLGGERAGYLDEVKRIDGVVWESEGWVTVRDAVFYGLIVSAPQAEFRAHRALWERIAASFVIHPVER